MTEKQEETEKNMAKAFEGIRIVDFTQVLAGPFATAQLALLGAEVIKIEQPGAGDQARIMMANGELLEKRLAPNFIGVNTGKRGITLDLKSPKAKEVIERLVRGADVVVQNFKGGVIDRLGFGYDDIRKIKPDIIYCSISGYGQTGPKAGVAAYDGAVQAASGMMSLTGTPESGPLRAGYMAVDLSTAIMAAFAISSALYRRQVTGEGQFLDVAMNDTAITMMNPIVCNLLIGGQQPQLLGNTSPTFQGTANTWPTSDGHVSIAVVTNKHALGLCRALGMPEWQSEPRYCTEEGRIEFRDRIKDEIGNILLTDTSDVWVERVRAEGIPISKVNTLAEALRDEQLDHRGVLMKLPAPQGLGGEVTVPGVGFTCSVDSPGADRPAPALGQHTDEVLREHGYSDEEISLFRRDGII
jgi:crotonobetainyl-CoA:carnitine CoA-transferase CaiB-like acyl-CoA transferase